MKEKVSIELLTATSALTWFKITFLPSGNLLAWVFIAMLVDLITGVAKAYVQDQVRTSTGLRRTIIKFTQYTVAILICTVLGNVLPPENVVVGYVGDGLLIFIIYVEAVSVLENAVAIDSESTFSKYFLIPLHKLLTVAIKKTPLAQTKTDSDEKL